MPYNRNRRGGRPPGQEGPGKPYNGQRGENEETESRLHALIIRIGEKSNSSIESNLEVLAEVLDKQYASYKDQIIATLSACVTEMPHKTCIYSTLVGLLNSSNYEFGQQFLEHLCRGPFQDILDTCDFVKARITTRFLADLVNTNVVLPASLLSLLDQFLAVTAEMDIPQERSDHFVEMVLDSLPWVARELSQTRSTALSQLMKQISTYMARRTKDYLACMTVWAEGASGVLPQEENLNVMWRMVRNMEKRGWQEDAILRPYRAFESELASGMQHPLPLISIPQHRPGQSLYPLPKVLFRLWDPVDVAQSEPPLPASDRIERYVIEEQIRDILTTHEPNRKECIKCLMTIPNANRFPIEYLIVEAILGELFRLPSPQFRLIYYEVMLLELTRLPGTGFANIVAMAVEMLYDRVDAMDIECVQRFGAWFAWHLSNNDFTWHWEDWSEVLQAPANDPRASFVKETLGRCVRLSYYERIKKTLTDDMQQVMLTEIKPHFMYGPDSGNAYTAIAQELVTALQSKSPKERIVNILEKVNEEGENALQGEAMETEASEDKEAALAKEKVSLLIQCMLWAFSKSYSHIISGIERYLDLLHSLISTPELKIQAVDSVAAYLSDNQQMIIILMDKLMTYRVVGHQAIIQSFLAKDKQQNFMRDYVWEVLCNTLNKMIARTKQVAQRAAKEEEARRALEEAGESQSEALQAQESRANQVTETLSSVKEEQKEAFFVVFKQLVKLLTESLRSRQDDLIDPYQDAWFRVTTNRLKHIGRLYHKEIAPYMMTLEAVVFTPDTPSEIISVFKEFRCLHR